MTANPKLALDQKNLGKQGAFIDDKAPVCSDKTRGTPHNHNSFAQAEASLSLPAPR